MNMFFIPLHAATAAAKRIYPLAPEPRGMRWREKAHRGEYKGPPRAYYEEENLSRYVTVLSAYIYTFCRGVEIDAVRYESG
jgi:hypothetical protein